MAQACTARYRARNPRATPLYRLFETHFEEVREQWEERFQRRCGFWRGFIDPLVCPSCGSEMKVIAFITEHAVVDAILRHLATAEAKSLRGPPGAAALSVAS